MNKKKIALAVVRGAHLYAVNALLRQERADNLRLQDSLRQVSAKLADVEALYLRKFNQDKRIDGIGYAFSADYLQGWDEGRDVLLSDLDEILHPQDDEFSGLDFVVGEDGERS